MKSRLINNYSTNLLNRLIPGEIKIEIKTFEGKLFFKLLSTFLLKLSEKCFGHRDITIIVRAY